MYYYYAFGLTIASDIQLPELPAVQATPPDVTIRLEPDRPMPTGTLNHPIWREFTPRLAILAFERLGVLSAEEGREIVVTPAPAVWDVSIRLFLLGPLITAILHQRGKLVLHASAVEVDGGAVLIAGESGQGKSSLAAALLARGHALIADDVAAIDLDSGAPSIVLSFAQLKADSKVAAALGYDVDTLPLLHPQAPERRWLAGRASQVAHVPLKCIYILDQDCAATIAPLGSQEAIMALVRHSCPTRWGLPGGTAHFSQVVQLARQVSLYRLKRTGDLPDLSGLAKLVEDHCKNCR